MRDGTDSWASVEVIPHILSISDKNRNFGSIVAGRNDQDLANYCFWYCRYLWLELRRLRPYRMEVDCNGLVELVGVEVVDVDRLVWGNFEEEGEHDSFVILKVLIGWVWWVVPEIAVMMTTSASSETLIVASSSAATEIDVATTSNDGEEEEESE